MTSQETVLRTFIATGIAAALCACAAVGPELAAPTRERAPPRFADRHAGSPRLAAPAGAENSVLPVDRWAAFGDPELIALQTRARENNADLATAALHLAQARVQRSTVAAQHGAQVNAHGAASRQRQSQSGAATRFLAGLPVANHDELLDLIGEPYSLYQAGFDASWELDLWGRIRRSIESADAETDTARAVLADVRASVVAEVARGWIELRSVGWQIAVLAREQATAADLLELIEARRAGGLTDESATLRQRTVVEDLGARMPPLLERASEAMRRIELLCGEQPGALAYELAARRDADAGSATDADIGTSLVALPDLALGVPSTLVERRPDIAAAEARLHAATASIGVAVGDLYPRVTLGASFGSESVGAVRFGNWSSVLWSIGPSMTLPIFDAARRRSTVTLRELQRQEALVAYQQTVLRAWHEVDAAITMYMAERRRGERVAAKLRASVDALWLARVRFERGVTDDLPVLDAQRVELEAAREAAESHGRLGAALVAVYKALGDNDAM